MRTLLTLLAVAVVLSGCTGLTSRSIDDPLLLNTQEVTTVFSGHTVRSYNFGRKINTLTYYDANGSVLQERFWEVRRGRWHVMPDGQICLVFDQPTCRFVGRARGNLYKYRRNAQGQLKAIIRYADFTAGNVITP